MADHVPAPRGEQTLPASRPSRRALLTGGALIATGALASCGRLRLGQPAEYTPPPMGIDDIYREDLLESLGTLRSAVRGDLDAPEGAREALSELRSALAEHVRALTTGAEAPASASASDAGATASTASTSSGASGSAQKAPTDLPSLLVLLGRTITLAAGACVQCSGSLARVVAAIAAHLQWASGRIVRTADDSELSAPAVPAPEDIPADRTVPDSDPPSVAAASDYESSLRKTQGDEWYTGYVYEVLAARLDEKDSARKGLLSRAEDHRARAETMDDWAAKGGFAPAARQGVYPMPEDQERPALDRMLATALLTDWVIMVGAVRFDERAQAVVWALEEARSLVTTSSRLAPLPSLETTGS